MTMLDSATRALDAIRAELSEPTKGGMESVELAEKIRAVRPLLAGEAEHWIDAEEAQRLLAMNSERYLNYWVNHGLLRSRTLPNGEIEIALNDVLFRREATEGLSAIGGDDLTDDDLRIMRETRPGRNPWDRNPKAARS